MLIPGIKTAQPQKQRRSLPRPVREMHVLGPFGKQGIVQPRQARVQLLVSGLNAREINRHGAKGAQASTAELSDSRNSRERPS